LVGIEEGGAFTPPGGEVEFVVDDERVGGVFAVFGGPVDFPEDLAISLGNDVHRFVAKDGEGGLVSAGEGDGGGVSAGEGGGVPEDFSGVFVEGDAGLVGVEKESVTDDDGGGGEAPGGHEGFGYGGEVGGPTEITIGFVPARDEALFAISVEPFSVDDGRGIGATGVVFGDEVLGVVLAPERFSGGGVEALDEVIACEVAEGVCAVFRDDDAGVAHVDFGGPEDLGAGRGPLMGPSGFVVEVSVAIGAAPLGPGGESGEGKEEKDEECFHRIGKRRRSAPTGTVEVGG